MEFLCYICPHERILILYFIADQISVNNHENWTTHPGLPDLEKYRQVHHSNNKHSKVADMAEAANLLGNDIMGYNNDNNNDTNRCQDGL